MVFFACRIKRARSSARPCVGRRGPDLNGTYVTLRGVRVYRSDIPEKGNRLEMLVAARILSAAAFRRFSLLSKRPAKHTLFLAARLTPDCCPPPNPHVRDSVFSCRPIHSFQPEILVGRFDSSRYCYETHISLRRSFLAWARYV